MNRANITDLYVTCYKSDILVAPDDTENADAGVNAALTTYFRNELKEVNLLYNPIGQITSDVHVVIEKATSRTSNSLKRRCNSASGRSSCPRCQCEVGNSSST